jgi:formate-dependent nitrite reductase membrane component NrfD
MIVGAAGGLLSFITALVFFNVTLGQALLLYSGIGTGLAICLIVAGMARRQRPMPELTGQLAR